MNPWLEASNILAVRLDNMGDIVMLGPALRAVKETSPQARITLLASPAGELAAELLPWVDATITWQPVWQDLHNRISLGPERERTLPDILRAYEFDAALIFTSFSQTPHVPGFVCYLAGIPLRAGESKEFGGATLTTELSGAPDDMHQTERNLRLVEHLGFRVRDRSLRVDIDAPARERARKLLVQAGIDTRIVYVLLHPGASCQARRYPASRYGRVARLLRERGYQVLITGTERELALLEPVFSEVPDAARLIGETSVPEFAALIEGAAVVVCSSTLPLHLVDATLTPAVVLFAGTDLEAQWKPRYTRHTLIREPTPCYPCYLLECPIGQPCIDIDEGRVVAAVEQLLPRQGGQALGQEAAG